MLDIHGRIIDYARISVTDRCNLNCIYCMPKGQELQFLENHQLMSIDDIYTITKVLANIGVTKIKITGGEPLLRHDIIEIIEKIRTVEKIKNITLTTNGVLLDKHIDQLYKNGIRDINISLDSLSPQKYNEITNFKLDKIIDTIQNLKSYDNMNVKINVVPIDIKQDEILELIEFSKKMNVKIRFIEMMPIGYGKQFKSLSNDEILEGIRKVFGNYEKSNAMYGNGPAIYYKFDRLNQEIGFISAMSNCFCDNCNRIRITSDGKLKPCLNFESVFDLKTAIKDNNNLYEVQKEIEDFIYNKPQSHKFLDFEDDGKDMKSMYQIGG